MSGGAYDYVHWKIKDVADRLRGKQSDPLRRAFAEHLEKVAEAVHDVEWVDSGDYSPGDEHKAIQDVIGKTHELDAAVAIARDVLAKLEAAIKRAGADP